MEEATENFVEEADDLTDVDSHAGTAIKLMKMRELVLGKEIKYLLFMASLSHLRVVSCFHPRREGSKNATGGWRPVWPAPRPYKS